MVNENNVTFPITLAAFTSLQRAENSRGLTATELELFAEIVDMANESYAAACKGDADTVQALLDAINAAAAAEPNAQRVAALCRGWVLLGCRKGAEQLKASFDCLS